MLLQRGCVHRAPLERQAREEFVILVTQDLHHRLADRAAKSAQRSQYQTVLSVSRVPLARLRLAKEQIASKDKMGSNRA